MVINSWLTEFLLFIIRNGIFEKKKINYKQTNIAIAYEIFVYNIIILPQARTKWWDLI